MILLGAGITGLSTAYHLTKKGFTDFELFDVAPRPGGLCKSDFVQGYTLDYGVHTFFTSSDYVDRLYEEFLKGNLAQHQSRGKIFFQGKYVEFPFQASLYALPQAVQKECLEEFIKAKESRIVPKTFYDWINSTFGKGIAKHFLLPYNEKKFGCSLKKLSCDFVRDKTPVLTVEEIKQSLAGPLKKEFGHNPAMRYPIKGGFDSLVQAFLRRIPKKVHLNHKATSLDLQNKTLSFENGKTIVFEELACSIPLPELLNIIPFLPEEISLLAEKLSWQGVWIYSIGAENVSNQFHWGYFPQKDLSFFRLSIPSTYTKEVAPEGKGLIQAETTEKTSIKRIKKDLVKAKLLKKSSQACFEHEMFLPYAYVRNCPGDKKAIEKIRSFLKQFDVHLIGRFGAWKYLNADTCILEGRDFADERIKSNAV